MHASCIHDYAGIPDSIFPALLLSLYSFYRWIASSFLDAVMIANIVKLALLQSYHIVSPTALLSIINLPLLSSHSTILTSWANATMRPSTSLCHICATACSSFRRSALPGLT